MDSHPDKALETKIKLSDIINDTTLNINKYPYLLPAIKDGVITPFSVYLAQKKIFFRYSEIEDIYHNLENWIKEGYGIFIPKEYEKYFNFLKNNGILNFSGCILEANCVKTIFETSADFTGATFKGKAPFSYAKFEKGANFTGATFEGEALFSKATFKEWADFSKATFEGRAFFKRVTFNGETDFSNSTFMDVVKFDNSDFKKRVMFNSVNKTPVAKSPINNNNGDLIFGNSYFSFNNCSFDYSCIFDGTVFHRVPDFRFISYKNSNFRFDKTKIISTAELLKIENKKTEESSKVENTYLEISYKYKALKELAIAGNDYRSEIYLFGEELEATRLSLKKNEKPDLEVSNPHIKKFGLSMFKWLADYGRSIVRPIICFIGLGIITIRFGYTLIYNDLLLPVVTDYADYKDIIDYNTATTFSIKVINPLLFNTGYGINLDAIDGPLWLLGIPFIIIILKLLSLLLIFLIGLGIRNEFRIKG
ncbi:MAG: pentapeptide repeat-containing protein [Methylacidiphilales bacterium]|nr:pentapeptide repeat-containing protein [Candidatus Methylacidiphilales bacterium]